MGLERGDFVSWSTAAGTARGRVEKLDGDSASVLVFRQVAEGEYRPTKTLVTQELASLEKVDQDKPVAKTYDYPVESSGGVHIHAVDRQKMQTHGDGAHSHTFLLPDGYLIYTLADGIHTHSMPSTFSTSTDVGGEHRHAVEFPDRAAETSMGGSHGHQLQVHSTAQDGLHTHLLEYDGVTLESLTPSDYFALMHGSEAAPQAEEVMMSLGTPVSQINAPVVRKCSTEHLQALHRYMDRLYDLNLAKNDAANVGILSRKLLLRATHEVVSELKRREVECEDTSVAKAATEAGPSIFRVMKGFIQTTDRGFQLSLESGEAWELCVARRTYKGEFRDMTSHGSGEYLPFDYPATAEAVVAKADFSGQEVSAEICFQSDKLLEINIDSPTLLNGLLTISKSEGEHRAFMSSSHVPYVLRKEAVEAGHMPEPGLSGLPASLEQDVPPEYRYWKAAPGTDARKIRDALVLSGLFDAHLVRKVDGELRRLVVKYFLDEAQPLAANFFPGDPEGFDAQSVAKSLTGQDFEYIEEFKVSEYFDKDFAICVDNTPENRAALSKLSRPFVLPALDNSRVYATTKAVAPNPLVEWVDVELTLSDDTRNILKRDIPVLKADGDERIVFGIVLEPDVVDAQNDTYNKDEVKKAAHRFMEEFRNIGLQHEQLINEQVRILESYIAPVDFTIGGQAVKAGTWLLKERILSDVLWKAVKDGEITGFSIGGHAIRKPV